MSLSNVLSGVAVVFALVLLIRGRPLMRGPRGLPAEPPWVTRSHGLSLLLMVAGIVTTSELHASGLAFVLVIASMLVLLVPRIVASRQRRL